MKRIIAASLILIVSLMSSACSYIVNFVVVNESNTPIEIEYTLSLEGYILPSESKKLPSSLVPEKMSLSSWESKFSQEDWHRVPQMECQFDSKFSRCKIVVAPKEAIKIIETSDRVFFEDDYKHFQITNLEVNGESGKMTFEGLQLFKQFKERNYSNRFITYK